MDIGILIQNSNLKGELELPVQAEAMVILAHSASGDRLSKNSKYISEVLQKNGIGTFAFDLLNEEEEKRLEKKFDIDLLSERLIAVTKWCVENEKTKTMKIAYIGFGTSAAAALSASAYWGTKIKAVVSVGGRPDLAMEVLDLIESPTLFVVGSEDKQIIDFNKQAYQKMGCVKKTEVIAGAGNLFDKEGEIEKTAELTLVWVSKFLLT